MTIRKLPADDRIDEIVDAAEALIVREHTLAFGMNQVATEIASSRALIYVYFEGVPQIIDELCRRHLDALDHKLRQAGGKEEATARARALGQAYLDYLIERGPALRYMLRDGEPRGPMDKSRPLFRQLIRRIVADIRTLLQLELREAIVLMELLSAVPDSLAGQVRDQRINPKVAREVCDRLMADLVADLRVIR